jgi:hypothetical protein
LVFEDFFEIVLHSESLKFSKSDLISIFQLLDLNKDGIVDKNEFEIAFKVLMDERVLGPDLQRIF